MAEINKENTCKKRLKKKNQRGLGLTTHTCDSSHETERTTSSVYIYKKSTILNNPILKVEIKINCKG